MNLLVFAHVPFVPELAAANIAHKRHFARVKAHMHGDGIRIGKFLVAQMAGKRFLAGVSALVAFQIVHRIEFPIAYVALERSRPIRMIDFYMCPQQVDRCISSVALIAREWLDAGVHAHVRVQLFVAVELFLANIAFEQ